MAEEGEIDHARGARNRPGGKAHPAIGDEGIAARGLRPYPGKDKERPYQRQHKHTNPGGTRCGHHGPPWPSGTRHYAPRPRPPKAGGRRAFPVAPAAAALFARWRRKRKGTMTSETLSAACRRACRRPHHEPRAGRGGAGADRRSRGRGRARLHRRRCRERAPGGRRAGQAAPGRLHRLAARRPAGLDQGSVRRRGRAHAGGLDGAATMRRRRRAMPRSWRGSRRRARCWSAAPT